MDSIFLSSRFVTMCCLDLAGVSYNSCGDDKQNQHDECIRPMLFLGILSTGRDIHPTWQHIPMRISAERMYTLDTRELTWWWPGKSALRVYQIQIPRAFFETDLNTTKLRLKHHTITDKIGNDMSSGAELARKVVQDVSNDDLDKWVRSSTLTNEVEEVRLRGTFQRSNNSWPIIVCQRSHPPRIDQLDVLSQARGRLLPY